MASKPGSLFYETTKIQTIEDKQRRLYGLS
jgi:hypothetical protein